MKLNKKWSLLLIFSLVIFSNTCKNNVGLGGHIDITPPTCQLTYPSESLPTIRNSFTLRGVASDDNIVDKVKVVLKSADRAWEGALELPCNIEKSSEDAWNWSVVVNKPKDGNFPLKDGKYNVTILAYDRDGKEGKSTSVLIIDNTAPVLFLQRPSSFATSDKDGDKKVSDNYGADLILKGTAADDSGLSSLELFAYGDKWETTTIENLSTSINLKIDGFFSSTALEKGIYRKLYGDDEGAGLKTFPCAIKIYDNAKEYDSPDSKGDKEKGNVSSDYYLYEKLYTIEGQLIFPKYKVQDVYDMFRGTFHLNEKGVIDTEKEKEAKKIIEALKAGKFGDSNERFKISCPSDTEATLTNENREKMGLFGLNPFKNPTYEVLGFNPCKIDFDATSHNSVYAEYTRAKGGNLTIKISPNLDEAPLKEAKDFEFYYCELSAFIKFFKDNHRILSPSEAGFETKEGVTKITSSNPKKVGSSYMITVPVEQTLNVGSSYVILVKGYDKEDNSVMVDPASIKPHGATIPSNATYLYGVKVIGTGAPSDVKVTKVENSPSSYHYGDGVNELSDRAFVKSGDDVIFTFIANSENLPIKVSYKLNLGTNEKDRGEKDSVVVGVPTSFKIDKSKFVKGQIHTLVVEVTDATAQTTSKNYSIWCDDKAPELDIRPFEEFLSVFPKINGRLYDVGSGANLSTFKAEYTYNAGTKSTIDIENKENGEWNLKDLSSPIKEGLYKFYFNVKDNVGNEATERIVSIKYDKAAPYFMEVNGKTGDDLKDGVRIEFKNSDFDITKIKFLGKIKESNGIASLKIGLENDISSYKDVLTTRVVETDGTYKFDTFDTLFNLREEKEQTLILKAVDVVGRETILKIKVLADKTAPEFRKVKLGVKEFEASSATDNFTNTGNLHIGSTVLALVADVFDGGSGVDKLEVYKEATPNVLLKTFAPIPKGSGLYSIDNSLELGLGQTSLVFVLSDKFGKTITWKCAVTVENASLNLVLKAKTPNPTFSQLKDATTIEARGEFELSASGTNTTGVSPLDLEITVDKDNVQVQKAKLSQLILPSLPTGVTIDDGKIQGLKSGTSSTVAQEYKFIFKPNADGSDDGRYVFNLNSSTVSKKFVVIVDNKAPAITPIYPALEATAFNASTDIKISCYDEASGIKKVECEYEAGKIIEMTLVNGSYTCKIPTADVHEGSYTLKFKTEDKLGNSIEVTLPLLVYDKSVPTIKVGGGIPEKIGPNDPSPHAELTVEAEDSNALKSLVISLAKKEGNVESWKDVKNILGKTSNSTLTLDPAKFIKGDGFYLLKITCKDVAENSSKTIEKEIRYDSTPPILNISTGFPTWINTRTYKVEGTTTDGDGVGVKVVKYKVNDGVEQALSGKDNWDGYVELKEGENNLVFFAEDEVKNKSVEVLRTIKVDTKAPILNFVTPLTGEKLLADSLPLGEVEFSANDLPSGSEPVSGIKEVRYSENPNSTFDDATLMTKAGNNYKANITSIPPVAEYYFWAKDIAGNVSGVKKIKVEVDNSRPQISLKRITPEVEISSTKYTNKVTTIMGTASDDRGIKDIKIRDESGHELNGFEKGDWSFEGNKTATFSFSFDTAQYNNGSVLKIKATATDIAGNEKDSDWFYVNIKQETDIPVVTVSSFEKINETPLIRAGQLSGTVTDDDGIEEMWIKIGTDSYKPIEKQGQGIGFWSWLYKLPSGLEDGSFSLKFKVKDTKGTEFEVDDTIPLKRVRVKGSEDKDVFKDGNISFNYDRTPPKFSDNGVRFSLDATFPPPSGAITEYGKMGMPLGSNTVLGNKNKKVISVRVLAGDKLGLKTATLTLGNVTKTLPSGSAPISSIRENNFDVIDFNGVNISGVNEGSLPLKIEVTDNSGFNQTWQTTCIVDFKEPLVEITSPTDTVYYGEISLTGKITDEPATIGSSVSGVDVDSITYSIGNSGFVREHRDGATLMSSIENTSATWTIKIPNIGKYETRHGATMSVHNPRFWSVPIKIKGQDKAGNEVTSTTYNIEFDPNGEVPYVDILSPHNEAVLGGTVALNGIARVANPASGKHVEEIYLQLSETNVFNGTSLMIESKDYGQSNGVMIFADPNIVYWSKSFNASDLLQGTHSREFYFRLRGKSGTTFGEWTNPRKFTVSDDVAEFSSIRLVNTNLSFNKEYKANDTWLIGDDYRIKGSVTHSSGIRAIDARTGSVGSGIQSLGPSDPSWFTDYYTKFDIPIRTTHYSSKYGYIEFDIEATDKRDFPHAKTVSQKILLKYDNSVPSCAIGKFIFADSASFSAGKFTPSQELTRKDMAHYSVLVNGKSYKIAAIAGASGREVELENATDLSGMFDFSVVKEEKILEGNDCQIEGVAEDSGSGVQKVTIKLKVGSNIEEVTINRVSDYEKFLAKRGNIVSFKTGINTTRVPNGKGTLIITVTDEAGNEVTQSLQEVLVKNSPVAISNVIFATDLSGNGSYDEDEVYDSVAKNPSVATENRWGWNDERDFRGKIDVSKVFTYKDKQKSYLKVVCVGGYKNLKASLYRVSSSQEAQFDSLEIEKFTNLGTPITFVTNSNNPDTERELKLDLNNVLSETLDNGKGKFILKITDDSVDSSWYAGMKIATKVEIGDGIAPRGAIFPFFYNSDKDKLEEVEEQKLSSVKYEGNEPKGHIEIGNFETNEASSVSGKVILRGFCYDNAKIKTIKLTLPKDTKSGGKRVEGTEIKTCDYNGSTWSGGLTIKESHFTNTGHYVEWEYEWDSNTTLCAKDAKIKLEVVDFANKVSGTSLVGRNIKEGERLANDRAIKLASGDVANKYDVLALTDKDEKVYFVRVAGVKDGEVSWENVNVPKSIKNYALYNGDVNVPSMKINVVPYITKVTTSLSFYSTATPSLYDRTALGHYPCREDEIIAVEGFNLKDANFYIGEKDLGSQTTLNMKTAKSGALEARVGYKEGSEDVVVKSLNNTDDNDRAYNKCPNKINNDLLNNDVFIDVWEFKDGAYPSDGSITYPVMKVSPKDGKVGLAFANGVTLFNMPGYDSSNSNWRSARRFDKNWAQYVFTDFAFDDNDYSYGMATGVDMNKNSDTSGVASYSKFVARRAGTIDKLNNYGNNSGSKNGWGQRLENIGTTDNPYTADPDRIQSPSIATVTGSGDTTYVYLAYYDAINKHIRYRWGTVSQGNNSNGPTYGGQLNDLTGYGRMQEPDKKYYSILAGPETKKGATSIPNLQGSTGADKAGKYVSIAAIKNGSADVVVALWYNFQARSLMYAYCDDPQKDNVTWQGVQTVDVGGEYVKCAVDRDKGIHVAYYSNGDLKYAYLSSYSSASWKIATVDSYSLAGTHVSIDLAKDPTTRKWVPYIGYYMPGNANARLAYLVGGINYDVPNGAENEKYTGNWEISIVPTKHVVREYRISVGVWGDPNNGYVLTAIPVAQIPSNEWGPNGNKWTDWKGVQPEGKDGESIVGGNGTDNPILGFAVEERGAFELAQKK